MGASDVAGNVQMAREPKLDCYAVLGVPPNADDVVIRTAFQALAERYHPDRFTGSQEEADRKMANLTSAYEILGDPLRRRRYDFHHRIDARTAPFQVKHASQNVRPPSAIVNQVPVTGMRRRRRIPLSLLLAAVVVVAASGLYQYSGGFKEWLGAGLPALPIAGNAKPASETQLSVTAPKIPARTSAADTDGSSRAPVTGPIAISPNAGLPQPMTPAPAKAAVAKPAPNLRPRNMSPAAAPSEPCSDVITALGLCKSKSSVKDK